MTENNNYLNRQIITCLGNKRALLRFLGAALEKVQKRLGKDKLSIFDVFSGSGIAARYFKQSAELLLANDMEQYSKITNQCYLSNQNELNLPRLREIYEQLLQKAGDTALRPGIVTELYAPGDDDNIQAGERAFYTRRNAMYIDTMRQAIEAIPPNEQKYFLAPLIAEASVHTNTAGVFKSFYKNRETGKGQFGGTGRNALSRIKGKIALPFPVFSNFNCDYVVYSGDANEVSRQADEVDVAYLDPPYNEHPYGSNYFMLNLILDYKKPQNISRVSGIPANWQRSVYNKRETAFPALEELITNLKAKYVLVSFNSEGFIALPDMLAMLEKIGRVEVLETKYTTYRGCRNLESLAAQGKRSIHVREYLYLLEK
jgi:adenine-specific DNA-methyltransferase